MLGKKKIVVISLLLIYAVVVPVFAYMYFYTTEPNYIAAGIILRTYETPTMKLGFYWDPQCTQLVTIFDFGNMTHPNQELTLWQKLYIRNEGTVWNHIYWNSTLGLISLEITESWCYNDGYYSGDHVTWGCNPINGTTIQPSQVSTVWYGIKIPPYTTIGTYNWTLTVLGENTY